VEEKIRFTAGGHELEGLLEKNSPDKGVVITHPHPLYGGDMHNNVVAAIGRIYGRLGWTTMRFNFRGVGKSRGSYDDGIGEQRDVQAAIAYLQGLGIKDIDLVGYSFGAWVNALAAGGGVKPRNMVMVSPPMALTDFGSLSNLDSLKLIVTGSRDDIAPAQMIETAYERWNPDARFEIITGADHFFGGQLDRLEAIVQNYLEP
jgi:alpha/beta superfamily hydrolase